MIAVDKMGAKVLFLNPKTYETEVVIDGFPKTVHELLVVPETGLRLCADLRRRHPRPQSQSAASAVRVRSAQARPCRHHRSAPLYRAAYAQARARRLHLHHLRELGGGGGDRPQDQQSGRGDRFRLDQRPSPDHRAGRPAPLHRERGRRHGLGDRPAEAQTSRQDQDAAPARRHRHFARRPHRGRGRRRAADIVSDRHRRPARVREEIVLKDVPKAGADRALRAGQQLSSASPASTATP